MITAVVGGQFGSEGKGAIAAALAGEFDVHVRVGAANAGHTVYTFEPCSKDTDGDGSCGREGCVECPPHKHVLQQLPCAAYTNPDAHLVLGPGALISAEILKHEIEINAAWRRHHGYPTSNLLIDARAHIVRPEHIEQEQDTDLAERIGSTSTIAREGIGAATAARVMREGDCWTVERRRNEILGFAQFGTVEISDAVASLHLAKGTSNILLEGTQGTGLSLTTGFPPYTTSRCTTAAGLAADCGLGPGDVDRVVIVMRTFPIRVAGNSGPFYDDSEETTFKKIGVEPERTTVTQLERRVATWSRKQALDAAWLNRAPQTEIALTFADYLCPALAGGLDLMDTSEKERQILHKFIQDINHSTGLPVTMLGTGPHSYIIAGEPNSHIVAGSGTVV